MSAKEEIEKAITWLEKETLEKKQQMIANGYFDLVDSALLQLNIKALETLKWVKELLESEQK